MLSENLRARHVVVTHIPAAIQVPFTTKADHVGNMILLVIIIL